MPNHPCRPSDGAPPPDPLLHDPRPEWLRNLPAALIVTDRLGKVTAWSHEAERLFGWTEQEVLGGPNPAFGPADLPDLSGLLRRAYAGQTLHNLPVLARQKGGSQVEVSLCLAGVVDPAGRPDYTIALAANVSDRTLVEQARSQAEVRFRGMLQTMELLAFTATPEGMITFCNPHLCEVTGWSPEELLGRSWFDLLLDPDVAGRVREAFPAIMKAERVEQHRTVPLRTRTGERRLIHWNNALLRDEFGKVVGTASIGEDVTERQEAEEQVQEQQRLLKASHDFHQSVLNSFPVLVWKSGLDGRCNYFNRSWLEFTGRTLEQEYGDGWAQGVHPDDVERCLSIYRRAFAARESFTMEYRLRHFSGEYRWIIDTGIPFFEVDGRFSGFIGACYDITSRKKAEDAVKRYEVLANISTDAILFVRKVDGQVLEANAAAGALYGYSREELLHMKLSDLREKPDLDEPSFLIEEAGSSGLTFEATHRRRDGTLFPVEVTASLTSVADEQVLIGLVREITARKRREEVQRLLREMDHRILQNKPLEEILRFACTELGRVFGAALVWVGGANPDGSITKLAMEGPTRESFIHEEPRWDDTPQGQGPAGRSIRLKRTIVQDVLTDPGFAYWRHLALKHASRQVISIPLIAQEHVLGMLCFHTFSADPFDSETLAVLNGLAVQISLSCEHARHMQEITLQSMALTATARAVFITDRNGVIQWANQACANLTGYSVEEMIGRKPSILKSGVHGKAFYEDLWQTVVAGEVWQGVLTNRRKDGTLYTDEMTITPVRDQNDQITHFVALKQDVTERRREYERIRHLATHDSLTGLSNRRGLTERLEQALARARADGDRSAVVLIDLDHFKDVNDTAGHPVGDQLLVGLAGAMAKVVRGADNIARLGGDEFAAVLEGLSPEQAVEVASRLRQAIDSFTLPWNGKSLCVTASVGVVPVEARQSVEEIMELADKALYEAKEEGRDRVVLGGEST